MSACNVEEPNKWKKKRWNIWQLKRISKVIRPKFVGFVLQKYGSRDRQRNKSKKLLIAVEIYTLLFLHAENMSYQAFEFTCNIQKKKEKNHFAIFVDWNEFKTVLKTTTNNQPIQWSHIYYKRLLNAQYNFEILYCGMWYVYVSMLTGRESK